MFTSRLLRLLNAERSFFYRTLHFAKSEAVRGLQSAETLQNGPLPQKPVASDLDRAPTKHGISFRAETAHLMMSVDVDINCRGKPKNNGRVSSANIVLGER